MAAYVVGTLLVVILVVHHGEAIMCHRCLSAFGGCGDDVVWRMYPWKDCGDSYCVKVIEKIPGEEPRYLRECEDTLLKSTIHRLRMPVLRRHGYCVPARKNDPYNPNDSIDSRYTYCFCNDWNGCNSVSTVRISVSFILASLAAVLLFKWL
ncbi:hypothetical protein Bpfe_010188 [Biomphalaria pfeifferi]|uniref:Protein sleepless n=1 Tax=Biomphalaria pfeifferi TaxID=112525 RepID=A0AAD8BV31_BIOPF|nr:hypothetical protein Bpfe_010188 [Biomphalaria pfeifferi]